MRTAQRTGQVDRCRNSNSPDNCDLKYADLCASRDGGADAPATEKDEQEGAEEFADCPFRDWCMCDLDLRADMRRWLRPGNSVLFAHRLESSLSNSFRRRNNCSLRS